MKVSDYIVKFLIDKGITDIFGYPGGMVTHLMDSLGKYSTKIDTHIVYHEQSAAFAACGYAQASDKIGVAFATSGPGATNLITGICNAWFDSIPTIFITGQVNTFEANDIPGLRQKGFQELDVISMVSGVTKEAFYVERPEQIRCFLEKAFFSALDKRKGPVLLDIPMNIFRAEIDEKTLVGYNPLLDEKTIENLTQSRDELEMCLDQILSKAKRPCLLLGNGIKQAHQVNQIRQLIQECPMPVISSMLAVDIIPEEEELAGIYYGFVGAYGNRTANFVAAKSDLIICMGTRLDVRQVGCKRGNFAPQAQIIRIDIDQIELKNKIHNDEIQFCISLEESVPVLKSILGKHNSYREWLQVCGEIKRRIKYTDEKKPNRIVNAISREIPDKYSVVADVGQNMIWVAQSFRMKKEQRLYMSGGHGAMGYALPAAIGIYYATQRPVVCFCGDGGLQMNIQELQYIASMHIPIKIIVVNNQSLGMIRHFQEMYFEAHYYYTVGTEGYSVPDFCRIANAYGIAAKKFEGETTKWNIDVQNELPQLFEILLEANTVVAPKLEFGKPNQDQEPLLDRDLYQYLMEL
mgnify:CR=1 FL=1